MKKLALLFTALPKIFYARVGSRPGRPCIGLAVSDAWPDRFQLRRLPYDLALARAHAHVRTFTPNDLPEIDRLLEGVDGLVLAGGEDVDPKHYGGDPDLARSINYQRDELELALLDKAHQRNLPVLCICRGAQLLAVWADGVLGSHDEDSRLMKLHFSTFRRLGRHKVTIKSGTLLHTIIGDKPVTVNSFHHQSIVDAGRLSVSAETKGGMIEGVELPGSRFVVGVQWHPELVAFFHPRQQALFNALVNAARMHVEPQE